MLATHKAAQGMDSYWAMLSAPIYPQHAEAFKLSADMILDAHQSAKGPHRDTLLFPVLYLYRHCVELKLKDLIFLGIRCEYFDDATVAKMRLSPL